MSQPPEARSSADVTIRACSPSDAEALALVGRATFLESYAEVLPGADILAHCAAQHAPELYASWLAREDHGLWIAEAAGGAPVGYVTLNPPDLPVETGPGDVEIKRIYLLSRYHGAGLGAAQQDGGAVASRHPRDSQSRESAYTHGGSRHTRGAAQMSWVVSVA